MEFKINCNVVKDLLPLYADGACSEETCALVESHLETCGECREALQKMRAPIGLQDPKKDFTAKRAFKKVKRIWMVSVILILVVCIPLAYLGVNQFANNGGVNFTNIPAILAANKVAAAFESNDAEKIKEKVTPMLTKKFEAIKEGIRKFDTEIIEKGLEGYLEDAKKDISDRMDFFKMMGFSFHDLKFAGCVSVGEGGYRVSYDIYYDIKAKGIVDGGTLYVTYKNGEITDVHESLSREILDRHGNWVSVLGSYDVDLRFVTNDIK